jgi:hypothetical protein
MDSLTQLELAAAHCLASLAGPAEHAITQQLSACRVTSRNLNSVGFMTKCAVEERNRIPAVPDGTPRVLGGVDADVDGIGLAGFLLFVQDGYLHEIEGFAYGEGFPNASDWMTATCFRMRTSA